MLRLFEGTLRLIGAAVPEVTERIYQRAAERN